MHSAMLLESCLCCLTRPTAAQHHAVHCSLSIGSTAEQAATHRRPLPRKRTSTCISPRPTSTRAVHLSKRARHRPLQQETAIVCGTCRRLWLRRHSERDQLPGAPQCTIHEIRRGRSRGSKGPRTGESSTRAGPCKLALAFSIPEPGSPEQISTTRVHDCRFASPRHFSLAASSATPEAAMDVLGRLLVACDCCPARLRAAHSCGGGAGQGWPAWSLSCS